MSIVSATIMDKCQQFIDKVSQLRFLEIKERQVNKFNRLLLIKQGNINWFSVVPLVNPWAGSASPQTASTSAPRQVVPRKTVLLRQPVPLPPNQLVLRQSALLRQLVPRKTVLLRQPVLLSPKQLVVRKLALTLPRWKVLIPRWWVPLTPRQLVPRKTTLLRQSAPPPLNR